MSARPNRSVLSGALRAAAGGLAALVGLAGCSAGGPAPTAVDAGRVGSVEPGFGFDSFGRYAFGHDGARLRLMAAPAVDAQDRPTEPEIVLVAVHGYGEHATLTYGAVAEVWAKQGVATYAYDQRGFGKNRSRGAWPGAEALIADLVHVTRAAKAAHPDKPLGLIGHSMGGAVALAALGEGRLPEVEAAVLLAPATLGGDRLSDGARAFTWLYAAAAPDKRIPGTGVDSLGITDNPDEAARLDSDPHYLKEGSPREYIGIIRLMDRAVAVAPKITAPTLMMWGAQDPIIPEPAVRAAFDDIAGPKRFIAYPTGHHLLIRDQIGAEVRRDAIDWLFETLRGGR